MGCGQGASSGDSSSTSPWVAVSPFSFSASLLSQRGCCQRGCANARLLTRYRVNILVFLIYIYLWVIQEDFSYFAFSVVTCRASPPLYSSPAERTRRKRLQFVLLAHVHSDEAGCEIKGYPLPGHRSPLPGAAPGVTVPASGCSPGSAPGAASTGPARNTAPNTVSTRGWRPPPSQPAPMVYHSRSFIDRNQ